MKRLIRRPSPAMAVALIALFVSLGGVSYGVATGSIDSREIRNNTVRGKDVRNRTLAERDLGNSARPVRRFGPVLIPQGNQATVLSYGPFSIVGQCQPVGTATRMRLVFLTREANSAFGFAGNTGGDVGPGTPEAQRIVRNTTARSGQAVHSASGDDGFSAVAPSGRTITGTVHSTANGSSRNCRAYGGYTRVR